MHRMLICLVLGSCLVAMAAAQSPVFDYGYFLTNSAGYIVGNNLYTIPTLGDWDADGDLDLMVGVFYSGNIWYYQNTAGAGLPPVFAPYVALQADGVNIAVTYG